MDNSPKLYTDLAPWWPLLSSPNEYAEEAAIYRNILLEFGVPKGGSLLELGSGGGNNASHLKQHFRMTLVDRSPDMLAISRALNPELEHVQGDMRSVRLERTFDGVFIHDAIMYMTSQSDLRTAFNTAFEHCKPGGTALFCPDCTRETFQPGVDHGGNDSPDGDRRALRYLEWTWDPDPTDSTFLVDYAYLLREPDGGVRCEQDRHENGLFATRTWLDLLAEVGFKARAVPFEHREIEPGSGLCFVGLRPKS